MSLWSSFPPRMRRAVTGALELAASRGAEEASPEHLLLAIARDPESAASFLLQDAGISRDELMAELERTAPRGELRLQRAGRFSSATLHLLDVATGESNRLRHTHVGTEHFILALAIVRDNPAGEQLQRRGLTREAADAALARWHARGMPRQRAGWAGRAVRSETIRQIARPLQRLMHGAGLAWKVYAKKSLGHPRFVTDPYPLYRWLREREPVRKDPIAPVWVLTRWADVSLMLKDPRMRKDPFAFERLPAMAREQLDMADDDARQADVETVSMLFLDPPQHTRVRGLFSKAFTPRMIEGLRPRIQEITDKRLAKAISRGEMDLIEDLAYPLPVVVIAELLGFPPEDFPLFKKWSDTFVAALALNATADAQMLAAQSRNELRAYFDRLVSQSRMRKAEHLLSAFLAMESEETALSREELFINTALLLAAGHETTTNLIGNGMLALLRNPGQLELLRRRPEMIELAVEELLRFDSPVQWVSRVVAEPMELGGKRLAVGDILLGSLGAANRDPLIFEEPDRVDITRAENKHLAFGSGIHFCLGAALARMEGQIAIGTMVARLSGLRLKQPKVRWKKGLTFRALESLHITFAGER